MLLWIYGKNHHTSSPSSSLTCVGFAVKTFLRPGFICALAEAPPFSTYWVRDFLHWERGEGRHDRNGPQCEPQRFTHRESRPGWRRHIQRLWKMCTFFLGEVENLLRRRLGACWIGLYWVGSGGHESGHILVRGQKIEVSMWNEGLLAPSMGGGGHLCTLVKSIQVTPPPLRSIFARVFWLASKEVFHTTYLIFFNYQKQSDPSTAENAWKIPPTSFDSMKSLNPSCAELREFSLSHTFLLEESKSSFCRIASTWRENLYPRQY